MTLKTKYRIMTDKYLGFQVEEKRWFWPFWGMVGFCNTHQSVAEAEAWLMLYLQRPRANRLVKYLGTFQGSQKLHQPGVNQND
jgi:hypothetical protein